LRKIHERRKKERKGNLRDNKHDRYSKSLLNIFVNLMHSLNFRAENLVDIIKDIKVKIRLQLIIETDK
jgi:hypothetical protein